MKIVNFNELFQNIFLSGKDDVEFEHGNYIHIDKKWVSDKSKSVMLFFDGPLNFDDFFFKQLQKKYKGKLYLCPEPKSSDLSSEVNLECFRYESFNDFRNDLLSRGSFYFNNYIIFSKNFDIIFHVLGEEFLIVVGDLDELEFLLRESLIDCMRNLWDESGHNSFSPGANYYWGTDWYLK